MPSTITTRLILRAQADASPAHPQPGHPIPQPPRNGDCPLCVSDLDLGSSRGRKWRPRPGSGVLAAPASGLVDQAALAFGRAAALASVAACEAALLSVAFAGLAALRGLLVQLRRLAGRTPARRGSPDQDVHADRPRAQLEPVARADLLARLGGDGVHAYTSGLDRLSGQRPRLDQPGDPEPLVDAKRVVAHGRSGLRRLLLGADLLQLAVLQPLAQRLLVELADARLRDLVDEGERLRDPPLRDARREVLPQVVRRDLHALGHDHAGERPLRPLLVGTRDHRRLLDAVVRHQGLLKLDRRDPLAARLDHVLRAIRDPHVAELV